MKVLSFIIPSYNSEKYLDKCITSFLDEAVLDKIEIIIVNDGSSDNTSSVAQKYCDIYPGSVRLISQENSGHGGALNTGCAAAKGKFLKVIDADDWVETVNLSEFVSFLQNCESDVVLTHHYTVDISTNEIKKWKSYPSSFERTYSFSEIVPDFSNFERSLTFHGITYNTAFYQKSNYKLCEKVFYEDHEFSTFPCCFAASVVPLDLFIYHYRVGDVNQSVSDANQLKRIYHSETVLKKLVSEYENSSDQLDAASREFVCLKIKILLLSYLSTVLLVEKDKKKGRKQAKQIIDFFKSQLPRVYELTAKKYMVFRMFNFLHMSKSTLDKLLASRAYRLLKGTHDFK